jgi:predicted RNA-binding protein with PUA domain
LEKIKRKATKYTSSCDYMKLKIIKENFFDFCIWFSKINDTNTNIINITRNYRNIEKIQITKTKQDSYVDDYIVSVSLDIGTYPIAKISRRKQALLSSQQHY